VTDQVWAPNIRTGSSEGLWKICRVFKLHEKCPSKDYIVVMLR
jgi:hypothetical protein